MVSPLATLSLAIHSNPGAYSVLVGSGVSVGAGVPTGWGVVLDLIAKLARLEGLDAGEDPAAWYEARYGEEPDYSRLLDALAKSPAERSMLVRCGRRHAGDAHPRRDRRPSPLRCRTDRPLTRGRQPRGGRSGTGRRDVERRC